ncbi:hypothetical protein C1H46_040781 [Malus baccata]|uniref:Uncharacterized protein n=1 Tax=Malus baccata TaxID=106549 RepID=A0A540KHI6_MALBA|nr:hypothetical protein C1H46_040781 [Malus baccata]
MALREKDAEEMASSCMRFQLKCSAFKKKSSISENLYYLKNSLSSAFMVKQDSAIYDGKNGTSNSHANRCPPKTFKNTSDKVLDFLVDSMFEFVDQEYLPSKSNFRPVDELGGVVAVTSSIRGKIPDDFPEGVYIRSDSLDEVSPISLSPISAFAKVSVSFCLSSRIQSSKATHPPILSQSDFDQHSPPRPPQHLTASSPHLILSSDSLCVGFQIKIRVSNWGLGFRIGGSGQEEDEGLTISSLCLSLDLQS